MLFCTINDFLAYNNFSGYNVEGHKACPIYEKNIAAHQFKHRRKIIYLRRLRVLQSNHPFRMLRKAFSEHQENDDAPIPLFGLCNIIVGYYEFN